MNDDITYDVYDSVSLLWCQECSQKEISSRLYISEHKVRKILVTIGAIETEESKLYAAGYTQEQICGITGKSISAVNSRLPYTKCPYNQLRPTENALRIRKHRTKRKEESEQ